VEPNTAVVPEYSITNSYVVSGGTRGMGQRPDFDSEVQPKYEEILSHFCEVYEMSTRVADDEVQRLLVEPSERVIELAEGTQRVTLSEKYYLTISNHPRKRV
jgi:hypothetical protein